MKNTVNVVIDFGCLFYIYLALSSWIKKVQRAQKGILFSLPFFSFSIENDAKKHSKFVKWIYFTTSEEKDLLKGQCWPWTDVSEPGRGDNIS